MAKIFRVTKEFTFDAAHYLKEYHGKCENLHGHTYRMSVTIEGSIQQNGLVMDFAELKQIVTEKVISKLDHANINDYLEQSSVENLSVWVWEQLQPVLPSLVEIRIWETATSFVSYTGKEE